MSESTPEAAVDGGGWKGPGSANNDGLNRLINRLRKLEAEVAELKGAAPLRAAGIHALPGGVSVDGDLTVQNDGRIRVMHPSWFNSERVAAYFGDLYSGAEYIGTGIYTEDPQGNVIFAAMTDANGQSHSFGVRDNNRAEVIAVRDTTPRGLTAPSFSPHMASTDYTTWGGTAEASWASVAEGGTYLWSPKLWAVMRATADAQDTTGEVRLVAAYNGTDYQLGNVSAVGFGIAAPAVSTELPAAIPIGSWVVLKMQARRTAGAGKIRGTVQQIALHGF